MLNNNNNHINYVKKHIDYQIFNDTIFLDANNLNKLHYDFGIDLEHTHKFFNVTRTFFMVSDKFFYISDVSSNKFICKGMKRNGYWDLDIYNDLISRKIINSLLNYYNEYLNKK